MPKNVMKLLKPSRNVGKNDFDLSHRHLMTANFGECLPITFIETVPGDYIKMRVSDLLRAMPMVTSPFLRAKQHIDVWFTSYDDLWHNFEQFITQKEQPVSSALKGSGYCPHMSLNTLFSVIQGKDPASGSARQYIISTDIAGRDYQAGAEKLADFMGFGENYIEPNDADGNDVSPLVNFWRLAQYNKVWYDEYRQQYYDNGMRGLTGNQSLDNPAYLFNVDDLPCDSVAHSDILYTANGYNDAGLDRLRAMMQMRYRLWKKDLYTGALPSTQFGNVSTLPVVDGLLIQSRVFTDQDINGGDTDEATYGKYLVSGADTGRWSKLNDQGLPGTLNDQDYNAAFYNDGLSVGQSGSIYGTKHNHATLASHLGVESRALSTGGLDVLALRKAEALQIWRENALRAGNRISDNLRAHYGDDAEYNDHRSTLIGSITAPLNIQDIDAHAQTGTGGNEQLADVAGKGLSSTDEKVFTFKAHKFGCIMVMFSMLPEAEYESNGIDRNNQLIEMEDYFVSEYQNTGLEAISAKTFARRATGTRGYAPAYFGHKQKLDKCFGGFHMNQPFAPWASPKTDIAYNNIASLETLYVNPRLFNRNFGIDVTGTPGSEATTEQFICDFFFDVRAVRPMSVVGLPQNI